LNCVYEEGWTIEHAKILYAQLKELADYIFENNLQEEVYLSIFSDTSFCPIPEEDVQPWCGGSGAMLAVDYKGDLYPCIRYMESSLGTTARPLIIGNVWDGILHTEEQCKMCVEMNAVTRRTQSTDECFYCPIARGCSYCSAYNYQCFGTIDSRATFICIMHKARALANAYYWNKYYRMYEPNKRFKIWMPEEWALEIIDADEFMLLKVLESALEIE
jgi:radical SAM protein with 4Fe4S-binding SPASM domain